MIFKGRRVWRTVLKEGGFLKKHFIIENKLKTRVFKNCGEKLLS